MYSDRKMERIVNSLEFVKEGKLGLIKKVEGQFIYLVEAYPYKEGFYMLCTTEDTRQLSYKFRKILVFIDALSQVNILAQCEIKNELAVDTCVTQELIDANCAYEILKNGSKSKLFGKNKLKKLNEYIEHCSMLASKAIDIINSKYLVDNSVD